jgi:pyruvate/2-oxoacid:ferredoxin oxidoreductase alpha subunit
MQSEAGAAGALHGALKAGAFSTTFTASALAAGELGMYEADTEMALLKVTISKLSELVGSFL